jgi:Na+/melibiose symporter-like transporter
MDRLKKAQTRKPSDELPFFAFGHLPLGALAVPPAVFLPPYFAAQIGIEMAMVSLIFTGARAFDFIIDPFIGGLQDSTTTRFGRRRLWFGLACPLLMAFVWLVFIGIPPGADLWVAGGAVFAMYALYATMLIAHLGWAGELRTDYHGRTNVLGAVQIAAMIGATSILLVPGIVRISGWGDDADAVHAMGWMLLVVLPVCTLSAVLFVREPDLPPNPPLTLRSQWDALVTNASLRQVLAPDFLLGVAQGVGGGLFLFYFQYRLGFESESQILLFIYFTVGVLGVPIWMWLGRKIGKSRALATACIYAATATLAIFLIPPQALWIAAPAMALAGLHQGAGPLLLRAMLADVVDEDVVKCGAQRSGLFFGLMSTTSKVGLMLGPMTYAVLSLFDFNPALGESNTPTAMTALTVLFVAAPALLYAITAWSLRFYKLDETRQRALRAEIDARRSRTTSQ